MTCQPSLLRFVFLLPRLSVKGDFNLKDLPGSGERVDILCRALSACFGWGPSTWNKDNLELAAVIDDKVTLTFSNPTCGVHDGETAWAKEIRRALQGNPPSFIQRREIGLETLIEEMISSCNSQTWALDENGTVFDDIRALIPAQENYIIIGDHKGYDKKAKRIFAKHSIYRISLGEISYLGSHCVAAMISMFERMK
ncbi:MAG: hypothetical protein EAX81_05305 [Candidatus Thorarchaeota archaeon]|nr:hypothetical protein [Candidatus Thorarchaeota archaeon]